jgi:hypothetical protein
MRFHKPITNILMEWSNGECALQSLLLGQSGLLHGSTLVSQTFRAFKTLRLQLNSLMK